MKSMTPYLVLGFLLIFPGLADAHPGRHSCRARHPAYYLKSDGTRFHGKYGPRHYREFHRRFVRAPGPIRVAPPGPFRPYSAGPRVRYHRSQRYWRPAMTRASFRIHIAF